MLSKRAKIYAAIFVFVAVAYVCQGAYELPPEIVSLLKMVYKQDQIKAILQGAYDTLKKTGFIDTKISEILAIYYKILYENASSSPQFSAIMAALNELQEKNIDPQLNKLTIAAIADSINKLVGTS